ncbi:MAG: hypothetical protein AAB368_01285, partial [bacterium]
AQSPEPVEGRSAESNGLAQGGRPIAVGRTFGRRQVEFAHHRYGRRGTPGVGDAQGRSAGEHAQLLGAHAGALEGEFAAQERRHQRGRREGVAAAVFGVPGKGEAGGGGG